MRVNSKAKIEKACSTDRTRSNLRNPYLDCGYGSDIRLVATNGYMLCALKIDLDGDDPETLTSGCIPLDAIKAARKAKAPMKVEIDAVTVNGVRYPRPSVVFPAWRMVISQIEASPQTFLSFNASYLSDLIEACGGDKRASLHSTGPLDAIRVEIGGVPDAIAILIPMRL